LNEKINVNDELRRMCKQVSS